MKLFSLQTILMLWLMLKNRIMVQSMAQSLRVSTIPSEPFMCQDKSGNFHNGIEYKLIETIAEKEKLQLTIQSYNRSIVMDFAQLLLKYELVQIDVN